MEHTSELERALKGIALALTLGPVEQPDPKLVATYEKFHAAYLHTRGALEPVCDRMAAARD